MKIPPEITFETTETNWVCMIVFHCAHVRISISTYILTSIVTYLLYMHPLYKILNTPVMSICLVKQNDGTWVEKHQRFFIQRLQTFLFLSRFFTFFNVFNFFSGTFFTSMLLYTWFSLTDLAIFITISHCLEFVHVIEASLIYTLLCDALNLVLSGFISSPGSRKISLVTPTFD